MCVAPMNVNEIRLFHPRPLNSDVLVVLVKGLLLIK